MARRRINFSRVNAESELLEDGARKLARHEQTEQYNTLAVIWKFKELRTVEKLQSIGTIGAQKLWALVRGDAATAWGKAASGPTRFRR